MFDKMKQLMEMQKKMQEMKRQLENTVFEVDSSNGMVKIAMNGSQEIKEVRIQANLKEIESSVLEDSVKDAVSKAIKRSQAVAAEKMKDVTGLSLPGLV